MLSVEWFWKLSSIFSWEKESGTARRPGRCYNRFFVAHALPSRLLAVRTTMTHAERQNDRYRFVVNLVRLTMLVVRLYDDVPMCRPTSTRKIHFLLHGGANVA